MAIMTYGSNLTARINSWVKTQGITLNRVKQLYIITHGKDEEDWLLKRSLYKCSWVALNEGHSIFLRAAMEVTNLDYKCPKDFIKWHDLSGRSNIYTPNHNVFVGWNQWNNQLEGGRIQCFYKQFSTHIKQYFYIIKVQYQSRVRISPLARSECAQASTLFNSLIVSARISCQSRVLTFHLSCKHSLYS